MATLKEVLEKVKDQNLPLAECERLRDEMIHLHTAMQIELADLEKREALYFLEQKNDVESDISIKRRWRGMDDGQRMILLNRYIKATVKEIDSLKSRVYRLI